MSTRPASTHDDIACTTGALRVSASFTLDAAHLVVEGTLDEVGADALRKVADLAIATAPRVLVDLSRVEHVNAAGLGELLRAKRAAAAAGCGYRFASLSPAVERLVAAVCSDDLLQSLDRPTDLEQ